MHGSARAAKHPRVVTVLGILIVLMGLPLFLGGVRLAGLGGSLYYLTAGIMLLVSGVLLARRRLAGAWLYHAFLIATVAWSVWEVGFDFWQLVPRLLLPTFVALCIALSTRADLANRGHTRFHLMGSYAICTGLAIALLASAVFAFEPTHLVSTDTHLARVDSAVRSDTEWRHYGGTTAGTRFSPADQINPGNVARLKVAWTYRMGDPQHESGEHQVTPLQVGNSLFLCTDRNEVIALDTESGKQLWRFNPGVTGTNWQRCRGVGYHEGTEQTTSDGACRRRIIASTIDMRLIALDADSGQPCVHFGAQGVVDLKIGTVGTEGGNHFPTSAPLIAGDLVVVGNKVTDGLRLVEPTGGVVRAFNVISGALVWAWDPGNAAITGLPRSGETYTPGAPNMWSAASYDPKLGLIYAPLSAPTDGDDFWGGSRTENVEYFSNSVVALDASTGRPRWRFQTVHHDLWNYDLPPQPTLFDVPDGRGGTIAALIQGTKTGQIFLLDRRDGTPIAAVEERKVPRDGQTDDWTSPTQPYSVGMPSIGTEPITEDRMWGITPYDQLWCRIKFRTMRYHGPFTPPNLESPALVYPSFWGGLNWGGLTVDEARNYLIANDIRVPLLLQLKPGYRSAERPAKPELYRVLVHELFSPLDIPCNAPPWGTITAIDLVTRQVVWQIPAGTARDVGPLGMRLGLSLPLGLPTLGGSVATKSGLLFFSGSADFYLRAIDTATGEELWKARLPVGSQATPMTYISPRSGRQFVIVVAGGNRTSKEKGDYVIAFALD